MGNGVITSGGMSFIVLEVIISPCSDVDVGTLTVTLEQAIYSFAENTAPELVMVCVDLMETSLSRQVDIQLTLRDGSALSKHLLFFTLSFTPK